MLQNLYSSEIDEFQFTEFVKRHVFMISESIARGYYTVSLRMMSDMDELRHRSFRIQKVSMNEG